MNALAVLTFALVSMLTAQTVYVGGYTKPGGTKGISAYRFDSATGKLAPLGLMAESSNPSFMTVAPNGKTLYAVNEDAKFGGQATGSVSSFSIVHATGKLTPLNQVASK